MNLEATQRNEKRKLAALWCNGASTASIAIGIFTLLPLLFSIWKRRDEVLTH
jgi:hypothetical protein